MRIIKAAGLGLALSVLASAALAAEPAKCCCCKDMAEKASCCDKKGDAKPAEQPAPPHDHHQH